jgi:hydrogenase nickel incorporation protein HypB
MIEMAFKELEMTALDAIIVENIGNLVCPAEFDIGATRNVMILSVPEGDDKPLKYPLMFSICDALVVNKTDYLEGSDFDLPVLRERVRKLNPDIRIFEVSCKTGQGIDAWIQWLAGEIRTVQNPSP